ncbi:glycosyltransferase involved in cell wall biosynthesis [Algoriphagus boseongensis]|uniref:Glycosyltransferase involved in cell wall biosynthesis n=1 Tax=Algoriphagus boseongensis TaxID=1442587 RepID=A0A4R6T8M4_9BACT|nr:glycosyltransferase involved in cell wall biosynthesis [Algoriphagus boseongensis]
MLLSLTGVALLLLIRPWKRKKVLLLAQHVHIGGTASYFRGLCTYFYERGYEIQLLLRKREFTPEVASFLESMPCRWQIVDHELDHLEYWYDRKHVLRFYFLYDFLQQSLYVGKILLRSRASLLFVSNAYPGDLFPVFLLPVHTRFVIHSMPWGRLDRGNRYILEKMIRFFPQRVRLATVSAFAKNRILHHWQVEGLNNQLSFLYNYSPLANISPSYPERNHKDITVLTAGSVIGTKNPALWIRVAKALINCYPGVQFVWAGEGTLLNVCRNEAQNCPNIKLPGKVADMAGLYSRADIYFQPSKWESQGLAVLEAMSFGLPCVVTSNGGTAEMVVDGITGMLAEPDDEQAFISHLEQLINDAATLQEMGKQAFHRFQTEFSRNRWYARIDEFIEK